MPGKKNSRNYWNKRFEELEKASNSYGIDTYRKIEPSFDKAQKEIQDKIDVWLARIAKNNQVTIQEARKLLNKNELKEFKWTVEEYIKYGKENALNQKWMKELENASAKYHIDKLEALKLIVQQEMEKVFGNELDFIDNMARKVYTDNYYHSLFEVQKGFNIGFNIGQLDTNQLDIVIAKPWATDGKNFSDRVWQRESKMVKELHQELTRTLLKGKAPDEAIKHMEKFVDKSIKNAKYCAGRLIMTEEAYFHSVSQKEAFNDLNVEEFEIVATLDNRTSEICREMDGKHFLMKDYQAGITAPPFHCFCRSITCPYFNDEWSKGERIARGEDGKAYYVPDDMKYGEWKKKYVDKADKSGIIKDEKIKLTEIITEGKEAEDKGEKIPEKNKSDDILKQKIRTEYNLQIHDGRQGKHIKGSSNYIDGNSYLLNGINLQELVNKYAGTGEIRRIKNTGKWINKQFFMHTDYVGYVLDNGKYVKTKYFSIEYSKQKGVHIVPRLKK